MRSKSPLALMEQLVMVLVFALAAALCLRAFVLADQTSRHHADVDRAVLLCQNAAETLKATGLPMAEAQENAQNQLGGILEQGVWYILYDENWEQTEDQEKAVYSLCAQGVPTDVDGLWKAEVWADIWEDGEVLFSIPAAWQEVGA